MWDDDVANLAATLAGVALSAPARTGMVGGAQTAHDCRMLVVYPVESEVLPPVAGGFPGGGCVTVPAVTVEVLFVADCYPTASDGGAPDPTTVADWTAIYLADVRAIMEAVVGWAEDTGCGRIDVDRGRFAGPTGGTASWTLPVRITSDD